MCITFFWFRRGTGQRKRAPDPTEPNRTCRVGGTRTREATTTKIGACHPLAYDADLVRREHCVTCGNKRRRDPVHAGRIACSFVAHGNDDLFGVPRVFTWTFPGTSVEITPFFL